MSFDVKLLTPSSTVSKVLRQKEKYLTSEDASRSPIKKSKGRVPDIEKALANWVKNYQRGRHVLTDEMIREKALFFASTCGNFDGKEKLLTTAWLEKFKQKNGLLGAKARKGSFGAKSDSSSPTGLSINSALASAVQSPAVLSPISPTTGFASPSPLSPAQSQDNMRGSISHPPTDLGIDFQPAPSKSSISLDTSSSFSPTSTLLTESPFTPSSQSRVSPTDGNPSRPRSQTFPVLSPENPFIPAEEPSESATAMKGLLPAAMEDPVEEPEQKIGLNLDTSSGTIKRNRSNPEIRAKTIYPPLYSKSTTVSPISSPGSPSQDEARKALELVVNYFEQGSGLGAQEYFTIHNLMERLELAQSQQPTLPGGLTRIDEDDHITQPHQHPLLKKRSIHNFG